MIYQDSEFIYDSETGGLIHARDKSRNTKQFQPCGTKRDQGTGYKQVQAYGRGTHQHCVAWYLVTGEWVNQLDHINGRGWDNRLCNLRPCDHQQNQGNVGAPKHNTSGFKGVSYCKQTGKWRASIRNKSDPIHLGRFDSIILAALAYDNAARLVFGEFANVNFKGVV